MSHRFSRTLLTLLTAAGLVAARGAAWADANPTPIAIPLIGTEGIASPYPSRLTISAPNGPTQTGQVSVVLHAVTHACPRDIVVALVHAGEKFLLMNDVAGCRPLQGTTIEFVNDPNAPPLSVGLQNENTPFGTYVRARASVDGTQPTLPAPFPAGGPLTSGMPTESTTIDGEWDLYVFDKRGENRGIVAGGWSLQYETHVRAVFDERVVRVPREGPNGLGPAQVYPIQFDLSAAPEDLRVTRLSATVELSHANPDDVVIVLRSPSGTAVPLMANCGGSGDIAGVVLEFTDATVVPLSDTGPLASGQFRPSDRAGITAIPDGPASTFRQAMAAFKDEPVRGVWTLWIYDDEIANVGNVVLPRLDIFATALAGASVTTPAVTSSSSQPFVRVEGLLAGSSRERGIVSWHVANGTTFYDAGPFTLDPATGQFAADVPVKRGVNTVRYRAWSNGIVSATGEVRVDVDEFTYLLAEGSTGSFFDLDVTLANLGASAAPVTLAFLPEDGPPVTETRSVSAAAPLQIAVKTRVPDAALSTVVRSTAAVPLVVERTMSWDARGYGGHGGGAASPARRWLFAEGAQGFFQTFLLLANDNPAAVDVTVRFLIEGGGVVTDTVTVAPRARHTLFAGDVPQVVNTSFGIDVTASAPILAERVMYFSINPEPTFDGGHGSAGVNETSRRWFLAEGATGSFFDCFILIGNPNATPAQVQLTYLLPNGTTIPQTVTVAANSRRTIIVEEVDPRLASADVSTTVTADIGIVVERAMYWPSAAEGWREAHNSFGVTQTGLRWGVADGRLGGARGHDTFILLANPNPRPAEVQVRFLTADLATPVTRTYTLPPTSRRNVRVSDDAPELGEGLFSAEIQVLNFQPIAVEKAMYWNADGIAWAAGTNVTATRLPPP